MKTKFIPVLLTLTSLCSCAFNGFTGLTVSGENDIHTQYQTDYMAREDYTSTSPASGTLSMSAPNPIKLSWETKGGNASEYKVTISEDEAINNNDIVYYTTDKYLDFYNGKIGQTYYWNVTYKNKVSETSTLTVKSTGPRNLFIEGVENARDIGGWGNIIKQGMLYRSGRLNESGETLDVTITERGIYEMNEHFKIKTQIDLRRPATNETGTLTNKSVLGEQVKYFNLPMAYGGNNILTFKGTIRGDETEYDNPAQIKAFFEILADESNYPIHYHCSIGKDRTGCLSYLIEGLLGADKEYLYRDYLFTNFADISGLCKTDDIDKKYGKTISDYNIGSNSQEKFYNYLLNEVGISASTLDKVISILKA